MHNIFARKGIPGSEGKIESFGAPFLFMPDVPTDRLYYELDKASEIHPDDFFVTEEIAVNE